MSKHTPGPWIHATDLGQVGSVETEGGIVVAQTQAMVHDHDRSQRNANARLIAAAPDLLNALTVLADHCERTGIPVNAARAAIEKATGEKA